MQHVIKKVVKTNKLGSQAVYEVEATLNSSFKGDVNVQEYASMLKHIADGILLVSKELNEEDFKKEVEHEHYTY